MGSRCKSDWTRVHVCVCMHVCAEAPPRTMQAVAPVLPLRTHILKPGVTHVLNRKHKQVRILVHSRLNLRRMRDHGCIDATCAGSV
jgi:hypothetical protein